ncbi:MAG TPA: 50S ribosomal protein L11 methyltransferase [Bacteroidetes bacterium]|nr:50S ribosomal protein L11 methyltransferase [Bacteroidota bacterium]
MNYYKYRIQTNPENNEVLIALMSVLPFDTFVEDEKGFEAYMPEGGEGLEVEAYLRDLQTRFAFRFERELINSQNWNEAWESNFHPIRVGDFCGIRAAFHPSMEGVEHELIITPRMAFGTGHHATTYMVIRLMEEMDFEGKGVLDFGCGTGVLAILASRLGAARVDAVDVAKAAWENTIENCETNRIANVNVYLGRLNAVAGQTYGIVLANINRNVILDSLGTFSSQLTANGLLVLSGILKSDKESVLDAALKNGFTCEKTMEKNNWVALQCRRVGRKEAGSR